MLIGERDKQRLQACFAVNGNLVPGGRGGGGGESALSPLRNLSGKLSREPRVLSPRLRLRMYREIAFKLTVVP